MGAIQQALAAYGAATEDHFITAWKINVGIAGGAYDSTDTTILTNLMTAINASTFALKIVHLLPILGTNVAATRVALINRIGVSATAVNTNFVDADYGRATGLKGNGANKLFTLNFSPDQITSGSNGGFGYWENNIDLTGTSVQPMGCYGASGASRFVLDLRGSLRSFRWGSPVNSAGDSTAATNGHYYGQRSSATLRELYKDGALIASNTGSDSASGISHNLIKLMGCDENGPILYWKGRCACAYLTDGTLTSTEVADLHTLLSTYLIAATGR